MVMIAALGGVLAGCFAGPAARENKPVSASQPTGGAAAPAALTAPAPTARPLPRQGPHKLAWMLTRYALEQMVSDPAVRAGLTGSPIYQLIRPGQKPLAWPGSAQVVTFPAASELTQAVSGRQLPSGASGMLYDPEAWSLTPAAEQRDPVSAAGRAKAVAQSHGLMLVAAPALNLVTVHKGGRGPRWQQFLGLHLIGAMARNADVIELQAQSLERDVSLYAEFVRQAVAQAHAANPQVRILAGLSTNPPGTPVTSGQLVNAIKATAGMVNGYWLNIPGRGPQCPTCNPPRPDIGRAALRAVL